MAKKKTEAVSICQGCGRIGEFSFGGCAKDCHIFFDHLKDVVFAKLQSPCKDLQCAVPGANAEREGICKSCPLPAVYQKKIENISGKWKCVLGKKDVTRYTHGEEQEYR